MTGKGGSALAAGTTHGAARHPDRRVRRSRRALLDALVSLILEKGYANVTVQDIADRADVGRTTFYAHFTDKDALLLSGFESIHESFVPLDPASGIDAMASMARQMFRHAGEERRLYRAVFGYVRADPLRARLEEELCAFLESTLARTEPKADAERRAMAARLAASAFLGLLGWWFESETALSPDEVASAVEAFLVPGLAGVLYG